MTIMTKDAYITNAIIDGRATTLKEATGLWAAYREENGATTGGYQDSLHQLLAENVLTESMLDTWISEQVEQGFKADKYRAVFLKTMNLTNSIHMKYMD